MKDGQMRHVMRYENYADFGVIYQGEGDRSHLNRWAERVALNMASQSLGAYAVAEVSEVAYAFSNY